MNKFFSILLVCVGLSAPAWGEDRGRVISTSGLGVVDVVPDMATISLGVTHEAKAAGDALAATSAAVREILQRLEAEGVAPRDMQTNNISVQPLWQRQNNNADTPPRITGFVARNSLSIRVRELEKLGAILDQVVQDGANTFSGLQFSVQDPAPLIASARAEAVRDAMARASQLAEAAGVSLGAIQSISEVSGAPRPQMMEAASARMAADVPVAAGEVSLTTRVTMEFAIDG